MDCPFGKMNDGLRTSRETTVFTFKHARAFNRAARHASRSGPEMVDARLRGYLLLSLARATAPYQRQALGPAIGGRRRAIAHHQNICPWVEQTSRNVMPIRRQWWQGKSGKWQSGPWPVRPDKLFLLPGDSAIGLRLPLETLPFSSKLGQYGVVPMDPYAMRPELPPPATIVSQKTTHGRSQRETQKLGWGASVSLHQDDDLWWSEQQAALYREDEPAPHEVVRTALCVEPRDGRLYVFMPPTETLEDYLDLFGPSSKRLPISECRS